MSYGMHEAKKKKNRITYVNELLCAYSNISEGAQSHLMLGVT